MWMSSLVLTIHNFGVPNFDPYPFIPFLFELFDADLCSCLVKNQCFPYIDTNYGSRKIIHQPTNVIFPSGMEGAHLKYFPIRAEVR